MYVYVYMYIYIYMIHTHIYIYIYTYRYRYIIAISSSQQKAAGSVSNPEDHGSLLPKRRPGPTHYARQKGFGSIGVVP